MPTNETVECVKLVVIGISAFERDMQRAEKSYDSLLKQFAGGAARGAMEAMGLKSTLAALAGGAVGMGAAFGAATVQIGQKFVGGVKAAAAALADLAKETAPLEGIETMFEVATQSLRGGSDAMLASLQQASGLMSSNRKLMQEYNSFVTLISTEAGQRMPEVLSILQKAALATGESFDFLFNRLVWGVGKLSNRMLDELKVQVSLSEALAHSADMYDKTTKTVNIFERQMGLLDLTLKKLNDRFGGMPDVAESASGQLMILNATIHNIKETLGAALLPAFTDLLKLLNQIAIGFSRAIHEGGFLYDTMIKLGAVASIIVDGFTHMAGAVSQRFEGMGSTVIEIMWRLTEEALTFGVELVAAFAEGMISGAVTYITQALNFLSDILTDWLEAKSSPKILPDLDKWGMAAFQTYLHGMTQADFSVLKAVQGPLRKILSSSEFAKATKSMAGALSRDSMEGFERIIQEFGGVFGSELVKLSRVTWDLANAIDAVRESEERLEESREEFDESQKDRVRAIKEYNVQLRAGGTGSALASQLKQIHLSEESMHAALDKVQAEEEGLKALKKRERELKREEKLQSSVVEQMMLINDVLTTRAKKEKKLKEKPGPEPEMIFPPVPGLDIGTKIGRAVDKMKADIKEKLAGIFEPLVIAMGDLKMDLFNLGIAWGSFVGKVAMAWDTLKLKYPILEDIETWLTDSHGKTATADEKFGILNSTIFRAFIMFSLFTRPLATTLGLLAAVAAVNRDELLPYLSGEKALGAVIWEQVKAWGAWARELSVVKWFLEAIANVFEWLRAKMAGEKPSLYTTYQGARTPGTQPGEGAPGAATVPQWIKDVSEWLGTYDQPGTVPGVTPGTGGGWSVFQPPGGEPGEAPQSWSEWWTTAMSNLEEWWRTGTPEATRGPSGVVPGTAGYTPYEPQFYTPFELPVLPTVQINVNAGGNTIDSGMTEEEFTARVTNAVNEAVNAALTQ